MIARSLRSIAACIEGQWLSDRRAGARMIERISTDSRSLQPGDLFIALQGERFDGHEFVAQAIAGRAAALILSSASAQTYRTLAQQANVALLAVDDHYQAYVALAQDQRAALRQPVLGITGSNGKTSVRAMCQAILSQRYAVLASLGNENNHLGVPKTLLRCTLSHQRIVLEMGANALGEIAYLGQIAQPDVSVILNAADAHIGVFGGMQAIAQAKGELIGATALNGCVVLPRDEAGFAQWQAQIGPRHLVTFGLQPSAEYYATAIQSLPCGQQSFQLVTPQGRMRVQLPLLGRHQVINAVAAAAACLQLGADLCDVQQGLAQMAPIAGRLFMHHSRSGLRVIDDSYNANPSSTVAAIDALIQQPGGPHCLVLGTLAELGSWTLAGYQRISRYAQQCRVQLITLALSAADRRHWPYVTAHYASEAEVLAYCRALDPQAVVLVKGSRCAQMQHLVAALVEEVMA